MRQQMDNGNDHWPFELIGFETFGRQNLHGTQSQAISTELGHCDGIDLKFFKASLFKMILNGLNTLEEASRENDALSRRRSDVYD